MVKDVPFEENYKRIITLICKHHAPFYHIRKCTSHKGITKQDKISWMTITEEVHAGLTNEIAVDKHNFKSRENILSKCVELFGRVLTKEWERLMIKFVRQIRARPTAYLHEAMTAYRARMFEDLKESKDQATSDPSTSTYLRTEIDNQRELIEEVKDDIEEESRELKKLDKFVDTIHDDVSWLKKVVKELQEKETRHNDRNALSI